MTNGQRNLGPNEKNDWLVIVVGNIYDDETMMQYRSTTVAVELQVHETTNLEESRYRYK
jgi:hypothetical protein